MTTRQEVIELLDIIDGRTSGYTGDYIRDMGKDFSAYDILTQIISDESQNIGRRAYAASALTTIYHRIATEKCAAYFERVLSEHLDWDTTVLLYILGGIEYSPSPNTFKVLVEVLKKTKNYEVQQEIIGILNEFPDKEEEGKKVLREFVKNSDQYHPKAVTTAQKYIHM